MIQPPADMIKTPDVERETTMDALSDVLRVVHLTGGVFLHAEFFAPWCIASHVTAEYCGPVLGPASHLILYHYVIEGEFQLRVEGEKAKPLILKTGEVVMLPRNDLHLMGSDLGLPPVMSSEIINPPKNGGPVLDPSWRQWDTHPNGVRLLRLRQCRRQPGDRDLAIGSQARP